MYNHKKGHRGYKIITIKINIEDQAPVFQPLLSCTWSHPNDINAPFEALVHILKQIGTLDIINNVASKIWL